MTILRLVIQKAFYLSTAPARNVLFGGDLNLRDKELASCGGAPDGSRDCWEQCGSRQAVRYTWDMTR